MINLFASNAKQNCRPFYLLLFISLQKHTVKLPYKDTFTSSHLEASVIIQSVGITRKWHQGSKSLVCLFCCI